MMPAKVITIRVNGRSTTFIKPIEFFFSDQEDPTQDQSTHLPVKEWFI
jgi:hypothetical protein